MRSDGFKDACGVVGVFDVPEAARFVYLGLYALQHRGQESAGIAAAAGSKIQLERGMGLVADVFDEGRLARLGGSRAIGHVRYSTAGCSEVESAQPLHVTGHRGQIAIAHNGNLVNAMELRESLEREGAIFRTTSDTEVVLHLIARSRQKELPDAILDALGQVRGAYSLVFLTPEALYAVRDPHGFRPLVLGRLGGRFVVASETCAFDLIEAEYVREIAPGELLRIDASGLTSFQMAATAPPAHCIFEHVYFARPDSVVFGRSVNYSRNLMGRTLAREAPANADLVVPVPDGGVVAALGYSQESGVPFVMGLIRNHYVGRTFIEPSQSIRNFGVKVKLNPVRSLIEGKRVVLVDDSIVRGTTSKKIVAMVRQAGAKEVHVRISSPPTIGPCYYGIDTPVERELIASQQNVDEIRRFILADSLAYLTLDGLRASVMDRDQAFCTACFTHRYPVQVTDEEIRQMKLFDREEAWNRAWDQSDVTPAKAIPAVAKKSLVSR
ncbi:MAG: amidophosphoribosyltransferase [Acidobacteriota bacterium]